MGRRPVRRSQLEHIVRAAGDIADDDEIIVVGSQAVLGQYPDAPAELLVSNEADVYPKNKPERSDLIDGSIGEGSPFHDLYGYYAQGVGETTSVLPCGWKERLVPICNANTRGVTAWCLEVHDLLLAKTAAGRDKDLRFLADAARHGMAKPDILIERLATMPIAEALRELCKQRILAAFRD
jgi:hypothetical protein